MVAVSFDARPASAQLIPGTITCKYDQDVASYFPDQPKLEVLQGSSVHVCTYSYDGQHEAELVLPAVKSQTDVCIVRSMEIFLTPGKDGHLVESTPTAEWKESHRRQDMFRPLTEMQPATGACPPPGDKGYMRVNDVPDGTFLALMKLWRLIISSPDKFDQNLALVPATEKNNAQFARLKAVLTKPALLSQIHLRSVSLNSSGLGREVGEPASTLLGVPDFSLSFGDPNDPTMFYSLCVDWVDGGFKVIGVVIAIA
jgi:hypothetical protein